jgi:hypothetical protein
MTKKAKSKKSQQVQDASKPSTDEEFWQQLQVWISNKKGPIEAAAYEEYTNRISNGWKTASKFDEALNFTLVRKTMEPLAKFLESETPLTKSDRFKLARFVRSFEEPKVGRPGGRSSSDVNTAERNAVYWVRLGQRKWRDENKHQRVPAGVTNELIAEAINAASISFPKVKLSSGDIRAQVHKNSRKILD